jgi:hypothetical protein
MEGAGSMAMSAEPMEGFPRLPEAGMTVCFGEVAPGSSRPMPAQDREAYHLRIRRSVEAQAAGAARAAQTFVR